MRKIIRNSKYALIMRIALVIVAVVCGIGIGYWAGSSAGYSAGFNEGVTRGSDLGYTQGYSAGFDKSKEYTIANIDKYATIINPVKYSEVVNFVQEDQTDKISYTGKFTCGDFARTLKENANKLGIKCAYVYVGWGYSSAAHAVNAFETTGGSIIFFEPQQDLFIGDKSHLEEYIRQTAEGYRGPPIYFNTEESTGAKYYVLPSITGEYIPPVVRNSYKIDDMLVIW
ncbi:MAG: hypothetical protein ABSA18_16505 [Dehalococcoidia bacterium]